MYSINTDKWEKSYPAKRGAGITIIEKNGRSHAIEMDLAVGEPENPATWEDFARKFYSNMSVVMSRTQAERLEETILNIEKRSIEEFAKYMEL